MQYLFFTLLFRYFINRYNIFFYIILLTRHLLSTVVYILQ